MRLSLGPHAANLVTGTRVILTPLFAVELLHGDATPRSGFVLACIFCLAAASDVLDGAMARRYGTPSPGGRAFDHFADITFVLSALGTYAFLRIIPWWVPVAVGASFGAYVVDSWSRPRVGLTLVGSRIGHSAGVANYVFIGVLVFNESVGLHVLTATAVNTLCWLVPIYSAAAVVARIKARRVEGSNEKIGQSDQIQGPRSPKRDGK